MRKQIVACLMVICSIVFTGCASQNGSGSNSHGDSGVKPIESTVTITPQTTPEEERSNNEADEQNVEEDAFYALQMALEGMKSIENLSYQSYSKTISHYVNWDNPSTMLEQYSIRDSYGEIQRDPAMAHTRNQSISGTDVKLEDEILEENSHMNFSDYYVSKEYGLYYHYDDVGQYFHEELSDEFRTMEHLEELIELFMTYPEQLVLMNNESEEEFEGKSDEVFYTVSLDLSSDLYWDLIPYINSNFLTGTYDGSRFDDQTFTFIERDLTDFQISLTLDQDYTLVAFDAFYRGLVLDGQENEDYEHVLKTYFYNFNTTDVPTVPE